MNGRLYTESTQSLLVLFALRCPEAKALRREKRMINLPMSKVYVNDPSLRLTQDELAAMVGSERKSGKAYRNLLGEQAGRYGGGINPISFDAMKKSRCMRTGTVEALRHSEM